MLRCRPSRLPSYLRENVLTRELSMKDCCNDRNSHVQVLFPHVPVVLSIAFLQTRSISKPLEISYSLSLDLPPLPFCYFVNICRLRLLEARIRKHQLHPTCDILGHLFEPWATRTILFTNLLHWSLRRQAYPRDTINGYSPVSRASQ